MGGIKDMLSPLPCQNIGGYIHSPGIYALAVYAVKQTNVEMVNFIMTICMKLPI